MRDGDWYKYRGIDYSKAMDKGAAQFGWKEKWKGWLTPTAVNGHKRVGIGVGVHGNADVGEDSAEAYVQMGYNGTATIFLCVAEHGTAEKQLYQNGGRGASDTAGSYLHYTCRFAGNTPSNSDRLAPEAPTQSEALLSTQRKTPSESYWSLPLQSWGRILKTGDCRRGCLCEEMSGKEFEMESPGSRSDHTWLWPL